MNPIHILSSSIEYLWLWTYGIIAGWGLTFTAVIAIIVILAVRLIRCERRLVQLENRLVHAERDYNLTLEQWKK